MQNKNHPKSKSKFHDPPEDGYGQEDDIFLDISVNDRVFCVFFYNLE